ncbi:MULTISPECIES: sugar phosphate nucleotidyltransferase [Thermodesulfovibrio]|jgi:NDP-sugar pyrophosphorylase family protein/thiamine kinase-like enzyme|uniref:sugar phosphate nucleotidyltransferase n=1 Tax=Thermodesulfovibrio TaxID=28261 RepID=UPI002612935D|nr:sugar phosphate nucleotidyltransferase [Thermodesulfovibrio sp.]
MSKDISGAKDSEFLNKKTKGFILAAGFSKRLRPITEHIPKPLLPIAGEVLLDCVYNFLKSSGIERIGINLHYKAKEIEQYIKERGFSLTVFHEKEILNTGGALYNARDFLKDSPFLVHNADIYWDGNIKEAIKWHIDSGNSITLLVHNCPPDNKLIIDEEDNLIGINSSAFSLKPPVAFTGIAIYNPDVLELLPDGPSSVIDLWFKAKAQGFKVKVFPVKYSFWYDIGIPTGFARAVFDKLKRNFTSLFVHPTSVGCEMMEPLGNIVIERDVKIKKPFAGKNIIILPEKEFSPENSLISDCIVGKDFTISISGWQGERETLTHGGSARNYFRENDKVYCLWDEISQDFDKTVTLGKFLREKGFPVPKIIDVKKEQKLIILEDLGDLTLYSWFQCKRNSEEIINVYKKIIEHVANLHWKISFEASELKANLPEFDYTYFIWESEYFLKECVEGVFKLNLATIGDTYLADLQQELHLIADKLSKAKKVILHRDLQSQNIILKLLNARHSNTQKAEESSFNYKIYFVDYQSARLGPAEYDIASLLWDPYVELNDEIRQELVNYYIEKSSNYSAFSISPSNFLEELYLCRIQRHMQALGAYGFLSLKRGKRNFLKFIPAAIKLLYQDIEECPIELPRLKELILRMREKLSFKISAHNI